MRRSDVALATEDELSESVGIRLIEDAGLSVGLCFRRGGFGYLQKNMGKWTSLVRNGQPLLLLTDLDTGTCAAKTVKRWTGGTPLPQNFVLRVVVREVEAWLLADHVALGRFLGTAIKAPSDTDAISNPKSALMKSAARASRAIRRDLLPDVGSTAVQGIGYNTRMCTFVRESWAPLRAAQRATSLRRARMRIQELAKSLA